MYCSSSKHIEFYEVHAEQFVKTIIVCCCLGYLGKYIQEIG